MSLILLASILIRIIALGWSVHLVVRLRDWRMGFLSAMLALMALRQTLTLIQSTTSLNLNITAHATELPGLAVSVLAFLSVFFLERIITERRAIRSALQSSEEMLRQSQKMEAVGRLAGGVAHDFNNILTAILGYSEILLARVKDDSEAHEAAAEIHRAGQRAADLTRQLLAFGRKQTLRPEIQDVNSIVSGLENMLKRLIGERIDFRVRLDPHIGAVSADATQLEQVIVNLVLNARDALRDGGVLEISTREVELSEADLADLPDAKAGRYICLCVSDTGEGMDQATQDRIFEPFFTLKSSKEGTGLGLSMVFGIVRQSGGTIRVHSEPGAGAEFEILLPRVESMRSTDSAPPKLPNLQDTASADWTILLVEDDSAVLKLARTAMEAAGHRVLSATSGEEAVMIVADHPDAIDILLTDVVLGGMTGIELADRISAKKPEIAVVFVSGYTDSPLADPNRQPAGAIYLGKPFSADELLDAIRRARLRNDAEDGAQ